MKTLKLLIKTSFFNKNNDFLYFDIIKYIFNRKSNKVFISYIIKTRGQSNLTKSASRGAHSPVRGHPRGRKLYH